jgi:hypothetical protein
LDKKKDCASAYLLTANGLRRHLCDSWQTGGGVVGGEKVGAVSGRPIIFDKKVKINMI